MSTQYFGPVLCIAYPTYRRITLERSTDNFATFLLPPKFLDLFDYSVEKSSVRINRTFRVFSAAGIYLQRKVKEPGEDERESCQYASDEDPVDSVFEQSDPEIN